MTVKELIANLSTLDQDKEIKLFYVFSKEYGVEDVLGIELDSKNNHYIIN